VLIDGNCEPLLGVFLSDHIFIKEGFDLSWLRQRRSSSYRFGLLIVCDDLVADINAFITDINGRTGDQFLDFILRLAAEGTTQRIIGSSYHISGGTPC
jgi:hypothetical protein